MEIEPFLAGDLFAVGGLLDFCLRRGRRFLDEPLRLAKAVEAAKVNIQNNIEAAGKR